MNCEGFARHNSTKQKIYKSASYERNWHQFIELIFLKKLIMNLVKLLVLCLLGGV